MTRFLPLLALLACNAYDPFLVAGSEQDSFTNRVDLLFVVDNSTSMTEEGSELGLRFDSFISALTGDEAPGANGLPDAVDNYIQFASRSADFINFNIGITTLDIAADEGRVRGPYARLGDPDAAEAFRRTLLCDVVYFDPATVPADGGYTCDELDPAPADSISSDYLDCLCGPNEWIHGSGGGNEEGLEAVFQAMCRAVDDPPRACFERDDADGVEVLSPFTDANILENEGMLRDDAVFVPVVITDEGDVSRGLSGGDADPSIYESWFAGFDRRMLWAVIGGESGVCDSAAPIPDWAEQRYRQIAEDTNGLFAPIVNSGDCSVTDFDQTLQTLGELLNQLDRFFPLSKVPDPDTLRVFVDNKRVEVAEGADADGYVYDPTNNAVVFQGAAIPDYRESVKIYYLPIEGNPRELPF
ncbi:MAG: hypothetical protein EP330_13320 [Deltaproteobacteria bacterium]|nr:MAG: hypothetical protein EP330_13320 [Deltaproteobacteria bacterium]